MNKKIIAFITAVIAVGAGLLIHHAMASSQSIPLSASGFPAHTSVGLWDWTAPDMTTKSDKATQASTLKNQGITDVYIDISSYIDDAELPNAAARQTKLTTLTNSLHDEVSIMNTNGIKVHALAGNVRWSDPDYSYIPLATLDYVHTYNQSATPTQKLAGMQFDIEFYSQDTFSQDPKQHTLDYLNLTSQLISKRNAYFAADSNFALGFTAADWLDGTNASFIPNVNYNGKTQPVFMHLASQLKAAPQSYIAVMAYRNHTDGPDGTIARAQTEVQVAQTNGIKLLIGEETNKVSPSKLSFYGERKQDVKQSTINLEQAFGADSSFSGFAINDRTGYATLAN